MVEKSKKEVSKMTFDSVLEDSNAFIATINGKLENIGICVETEFSKRKRIALKKRMAGEIAQMKDAIIPWMCSEWKFSPL